LVTREQVELVLGRLRPLLQADGGGIELIHVRDDCSADVRLTGHVGKLPERLMTLDVGVKVALRDEIPEFETLCLVLKVSP
jgi:Fe-S cluster biogenesis protein NfuA